MTTDDTVPGTTWGDLDPEALRLEVLRRSAGRPTPGWPRRLTIEIIPAAEFFGRPDFGTQLVAVRSGQYLHPRRHAELLLRDGHADCGRCRRCRCQPGAGSCGHHRCQGGPERTCPAVEFESIRPDH